MSKVGRLLMGNLRTTLIFFGLAIIYVLGTVLPSPDTSTLKKYDITATQLRVLIITIVLPYVIIWTLSLIAYLRFRAYSRSIRNDKDGEAWHEVTKGILWIALSLPIFSTVNTLSSLLYRQTPSWTSNLVRFDVYLAMIVMAIGIWYVYKGSGKLLSLVHKYRFQTSLTLVLGFIAFAVVYTFMTLNDPARSVPTGAIERATYYEPDWAILLTITIPRLLMWFLGLQALYNITVYFAKTRGKIYKSALVNLAQGLGIILGATIFLRVLQTLNSVLAVSGLGLMLVIIYLLLVALGIGYFLMDRGARKLEILEKA